MIPQGAVGDGTGNGIGGHSSSSDTAVAATGLMTGYSVLNESVGLQSILDFIAAASGPAVPSTTATLSGPTTGTAGQPSGNFTIALDGTEYTGTITPAVSGGGTLTPTSLTWSGTAQAQTFRFTSSAASSYSISITASPALTIVGSPITYTATSPTPTPTPTGPMPSRAAILVGI